MSAVTTPTAWRFPYVDTDYKLHCPFDAARLELGSDGMWTCADGSHRWHRFGYAGAWRLMKGEAR